MKKKKVRMYKASSVFIVLFILFFSVPFIFVKLNEKEVNVITDDDKLKEIGYSLNDIELLKKDKNILRYALGNDYDNLLMDYIEVDGFDVNKVSKYYEYSKNNEEVDTLEVVKLVNYDIDIDYTEKLINIVNDKYFIRDNLEDYLDYTKETDSRKIVEAVNSNVNNPFYTNLRASNIKDKNLILVNKHYYLDKEFNGFNLVEVEPTHGNGLMSGETYSQFKKMREKAAAEGLNLFARSNYRSYDKQNSLYTNYKYNNGVDWADAYSARPGHSEHQTGLAIDVTAGYSDLASFIYTNEYVWMTKHAHEYGFILRYPEGYKHITGYDFEPWHYRYVGVEVAKKIKEENIIFEEYYAYYVKNNDTN